MSDFKAKMHQIRFRLRLRPRPRWGSLQRYPRPPSWIEGGLLLREGGGREGEVGQGRGREGWAREGRRREGREGEGKFAPAPSKYIWIDAAVLTAVKNYNKSLEKLQDFFFKTKTNTKCSTSRLHDPRPRLSFLSSRRLETKTLVSRTISLNGTAERNKNHEAT